MRKFKHLKLIILICGILAVDAAILANYFYFEPLKLKRIKKLEAKRQEVCSRSWDDWETREDCMSDSWKCISLYRQLNPDAPVLNAHPLCIE